MKEVPQDEPPQQQEQEDNNNFISTPKSPSSTTVSTSSSSTQSILSQLLKHDDHHHKQQLNEEQTPLIQKDHIIKKKPIYHTISPIQEQQQQEVEFNHPNEDLEGQRWSKGTTYQALHDPRSVIKCLVQPITYIPAVILGLLLNLLDAISYGMITFPLNNPIFASFGPDGISMFFVSCIISQLVYSCGGSAFDGGNGRAEKICQVVGPDKSEVVISSTVVAFAISSIMTGLAFFLLGALRLGSLIGFFPRHILVGTIGGVGWFLVATGIEVSARLDENLAYTIPMFKRLFLDLHVFSLWFTAFAMAILLRTIQHKATSPLVVPAFFMLLPIVFYIVVLIFGYSVTDVRDAGWIFPLVESDTPFWHFYTYYNFKLVDWRAVAETIPAMLALTFFGLLHVPINVPALGVSTNKDDIDVNRELVAHGISNAVSGLFGAVQNYLVYTNSLLFIRTGGDSRVAGVMLAIATTILWMVGPWIVGYIPVMVVGSLIFHLGLDLLKEALVDTWNSVHYLEYITICVIIVCMALVGFVEGIFVGIVLACIFFVVQNSRKGDAIRSTYTGEYMRSTVRRLYRQENFLSNVGGQIQVIKLQGYLFFGTINQVERTIRDMLDERGWDKHPIRFLILDLQLVQGLDFSAAEAFVRIRRLLRARQVYMILCNVARGSDEEKALIKAGIWVNDSNDEPDDIKCFQYANEAIEWCENVLLQSYFEKKSKYIQSSLGTSATAVPRINRSDPYSDQVTPVGSPRHAMLNQAIHQVFTETNIPTIHSNMAQPALVLIQTFADIGHGDLPVDFFHRLGVYFERTACTKGSTIYREGDPCEFLLVLEQGSLRSLMNILNQQVTVETLLAGSVAGELGMFLSSPVRTRSLLAEQDSVYWKLTRTSFDRMCTDDPQMAHQFMLLTLYFSSERLDTMTRHAFHLH
ncbi:hypothetical protein K501DRAFT_195014 [Backusella circina FSU 941]|nr:hypothetical protein K501DRAFT_195014 [Backusella circina FSU 941]